MKSTAQTRQLEYMADTIESIFAESKTTARITGGKVRIRFVADCEWLPSNLCLGRVADKINGRLGTSVCIISRKPGKIIVELE